MGVPPMFLFLLKKTWAGRPCYWKRLHSAAMAQLIITAVGPDRPGIVGELTSHLHAAGGNLLDSRMINLRGEFAMMILVETSADEAAGRLKDELPAVGE